MIKRSKTALCWALVVLAAVLFALLVWRMVVIVKTPRETPELTPLPRVAAVIGAAGTATGGAGGGTYYETPVTATYKDKRR